MSGLPGVDTVLTAGSALGVEHGQQNLCDLAVADGQVAHLVMAGGGLRAEHVPWLLRAGIRIYEYRATMTHAKVLVIDGLWAVHGTTNIDNRSFEHNDEINVALLDKAVAERLLADYDRDLRDSDEVTLDSWQRRPVWEKVVGPFVWILERQQ